MRRVRHYLPLTVMLLLYHTLIFPYLSYCNIVWGSAKPTVLNKILLLQKRAVRLCTGSGYRAPSIPLFKRLQLLKITEINELQTMIFMFKVKHGLLPAACTHYVTVADTNNFYDTRKKSFFKCNKFRTSIRENSLSVRGPKQWNLLPVCIQNSCSLGTLKKSLSVYLLSVY